MVLARTKECKPGQYCESRCCTLPGGDVQCRERCLGSSCELDGHCDGDCCVNSICTSCLLKRFVNVSFVLNGVIKNLVLHMFAIPVLISYLPEILAKHDKAQMTSVIRPNYTLYFGAR